MQKIRVQVLIEPEIFIFLEGIRKESRQHNLSITIGEVIKNYKNLLLEMKKVKEEVKKKDSFDSLEEKYGLGDHTWKGSSSR